MKKYLINLVFIFVLYQTHAQDFSYKNIVFEGAGIRGIAYAGVVKTLEKNNLMDSIKKVGGTSAGAIIAMMISLGYDSQEIQQIIGSTKFQKFNHGCCGYFRLKKHFGWYRSERFMRFLEKLVEQKTGDKNYSFRQLNESNKYKSLYVTGTCLNKQKTIVFSSKTYPEMRIVDAVRISMSIPLYFEAIFIDERGKVYSKFNKKQNLDIMVDGGILANFPIFIFDDYKKTNDGKTIRIENPKTLGIRIDSDKQIQNDLKNRELAYVNINNFRDFVQAFYILVLENLNRNNLTDKDWKRTVSISDKNIGPKIKKLSQQQKQSLIESGEEGMKNFLHLN